MTSIEKLARDLERVERNLLNVSTQPRLHRSSLDGGSIELRDPNGNTTGYVGQQYDGTYTSAPVGGTSPPSPTIPMATPIEGGLLLFWDGTYVDDNPTRMDFKRITFHAVRDVEDFNALSPGQIVGEITTAAGGEISVLLPPFEWYIFAVTWTEAGKFSVESDPAFATPIEVTKKSDWDIHAAALANLNDVALPGLATDLAELDTALTELNGVTVPQLQATADAAQTAADAAAADATAAVNAALAATTTADSAQAAADGAIRTYGPEEYPVSPPWANGSTQDANVVGDLWLNADGVAHRWNGSTWYVIPDSAAANALAQAIAAQADADAAAAAAASAYDRWAPTGATTIDGGKITADSITSAQIGANQVTANEIAADTITANEIAAESITGDRIAAASITSREINVDVLRAGFTLTGALEVTGAINVGTSSWTKEQGLVFPGSLVLPTDPTKRASINADVTAKSITVENDLNLLGTTNKISGLLNLSNGITKPGVAPSVWASQSTVQTGLEQQFGSIWYGAAPSATVANAILSVNNFWGGGWISAFDKTTGAGVSTGATGNTSWTSNFNMYGGITTLGDKYYVLGVDYNRPDPWNNSIGQSWWVYKLDSNFNKEGEAAVNQQFNANRGRPCIGNDGTYVIVASSDGSNAIDIARFTTSMNIHSIEYATDFIGIGSSNLSGILYGSFDFGATKYVIAVEGNTNFVLNSSYGREDVYNFAGGAGPVRGLYWDNGRMHTLSRDGAWSKHGKNLTSQSVSASYTWYDGVGTTRETEGSPATVFTQPARTWINMQTPPAPDSGSSVNNVDKANRVRFYMSTGGATRRLQATGGLATDGVTTITMYSSDLIATGGATEPLVNGFVGGTTSPGSIRSANGGFVVNGDGTGAWPAIRPSGEITMFGGGTAPSGWLLCDGSSRLVADYPALHAAIGYSHGGSGASFNLPDMRGRSPVGVGTATGAPGATAKTLGQKGGEETHALTLAELPSHNHGGESGAPQGLPSNEIMYTSKPTAFYGGGHGTSFNSGQYPDRPMVADVGYPTSGHRHSIPSAGSNAAHNNMPPFIGVNYIIKT